MNHGLIHEYLLAPAAQKKALREYIGKLLDGVQSLQRLHDSIFEPIGESVQSGDDLWRLPRGSYDCGGRRFVFRGGRCDLSHLVLRNAQLWFEPEKGNRVSLDLVINDEALIRCDYALQVGDPLFIEVGVRKSDPNEPQHAGHFRVAEVLDEVTFRVDRPIPRPTVWTRDELFEAVSDSNKKKIDDARRVADRGFGTVHWVTPILSRVPLDVSLPELVGGPAPLSSIWTPAIVVKHCGDVMFRGGMVTQDATNIGSAIRLIHSDAVLEGMRFGGVGSAPRPAIEMWGGDAAFSDAAFSGNWRVCFIEVGADADFINCSARLAGVGRGLVFDPYDSDLHLDFPTFEMEQDGTPARLFGALGRCSLSRMQLGPANPVGQPVDSGSLPYGSFSPQWFQYVPREGGGSVRLSCWGMTFALADGETDMPGILLDGPTIQPKWTWATYLTKTAAAQKNPSRRFVLREGWGMQ